MAVHLKDNTPPDLPAVIKEIVTALLAGDWTRYSDDSGSHFYYIIREQDHGIEVNDGRVFSNMLVFDKYEPDAFENWYVRAVLADEPPDRLAKARKRFVAAEGDPAFFDAAIEAVKTDRAGAILKEQLDSKQLGLDDALFAICEAVIIERTRQQHIFVSESNRPGLRRALEALFLRELTERFPKVVNRAAVFEDWISFRDPQLREAYRCYLYGFWSAAFLVAVAALEGRLKKCAGGERGNTYEKLVDLAFGDAGVCGKDAVCASALKELFKHRNKVAHEGVEPTREETADALNLVRGTS